MKKLLFSIFTGLAFTSSSQACDFLMDAVELDTYITRSERFMAVRYFVDDEGETRAIRRTLLPLNSQAHEKMRQLSQEGAAPESICLKGSLDVSSPARYMIYELSKN